jgi:hypothetical protein
MPARSPSRGVLPWLSPLTPGEGLERVKRASRRARPPHRMPIACYTRVGFFPANADTSEKAHLGSKGVFDYIERFHNPRIQRRLDSRNKGVSALTQPSAKTG